MSESHWTHWAQTPPSEPGYYWSRYRAFDDEPWGDPTISEVVSKGGRLLDLSWRDAENHLLISPRELDAYGYPMQEWCLMRITMPADLTEESIEPARGKP